jgi:hypothetical protein
MMSTVSSEVPVKGHTYFGFVESVGMKPSSDLKINPDNPRSLQGLTRRLRAEGKQQEAAKYENQFKSAWQYADEPIRFRNKLN